MSRGVGLGRVLGVPVRLDLSWFLGLAVVVALSRELWAPAVAGPAAVGLSAVFAVAFFGSVLVHELAHALVASGRRPVRRHSRARATRPPSRGNRAAG